MPRAHTFDATAATARAGDTLMIGGRVHQIVGITLERGGGATLTLTSGIHLTLPPVATITVTRPIPDTITAPHAPPRFPL